MIYEYLNDCFILNRLHNSYLLQSNQPSQALLELQKFVTTKLLPAQIDLVNNPDYMLIKREEGATNAKNISVGQIRNLQNFLYKTAGFADHKVAIIFEAEWLNNSSANCLLKVLEDTPKNSYIFLIARNITAILPTIKSRCAKISSQFSETRSEAAYEQHLVAFDRQIAWAVKWPLIKQFSEKGRDNWYQLANSMLFFIDKMVKKANHIDLDLSLLEQKIMAQLPEIEVNFLLAKYSAAKQIIADTINLDLELKASTILIIELLHQNNYV